MWQIPTLCLPLSPYIILTCCLSTIKFRSCQALSEREYRAAIGQRCRARPNALSGLPRAILAVGITQFALHWSQMRSLSEVP